MLWRIVVSLVCTTLWAQASGQANRADGDAQEKAAATLRARIEASPELPFRGVPLAAKPPSERRHLPGQESYTSPALF
jgi:hypothetical protein